MRIGAVTNNQVFKGLFIDKTKGDDWKMEYRPYSWENFHNTQVHEPYYDVRSSIMENKQKIDLTADRLPNNEEIFTPMTSKSPAISRDILGTVSYYEYPIGVNLGEFRNEITRGETMNLEESLQVALRKHQIFREMKNDELIKTKKEISEKAEELKRGIYKCESAARESEGINLFSDAVVRRGKAFSDVEYSVLPKYRDLVERYIKISESKENLDNYMEEIKRQLKLIAEKRKTGDIIDISVRHSNDPNKALYDEGVKLVRNQKDFQKSSKLVLLSHRPVYLTELIKRWFDTRPQPYFNMSMEEFIAKKLPEGLTHIADKMISFRL